MKSDAQWHPVDVFISGKEMMKKILFSAVFLMLSFVYEAEAAPPLLWCDGCSDAQKNSTAVTSPLGKVYVGDVVQRTIYAYDVYMDVNDGYRPPRREKRADRIAVDSAAQAAAAALFDLYYWGSPGWAKTETVIYPDNSMNVYDVVFQGPAQNRMLSAAQNGASLWSRIASTMNVVVGVVNVQLPGQVVKVQFWDGSFILVTIDLSRSDYPVKVIENSGQDSHENPVLSAVSPNPVTFGFGEGGPYSNPTDRSRWAGHMGLLGYNTAGATNGVVMACTNSAAGLNCVIVRTNAN